jgi:hypothetical protein
LARLLADAGSSCHGSSADTGRNFFKKPVLDEATIAVCRMHGARLWAVCTENSNSDVVMVKPAEDRV